MPDDKRRGFFGRIIQFFKEVFAELKKVITPTRKQLLNYFLVVLAFVVFMMLLVTVLDFVFGKLAGTVFGGEPIWPLF
ncbi:preprotein translocase subunit SecE [Brevibacterium sp. 50QC2O2]|uniref:preprotein translocase subunit SecE n=1 Tax=Brevibacterium TaxID=1696 RepID=UPI00211CCB4D|nr:MULTISPECIES: preprotein translocase subunit SecE [unclassified Brevibacterium]MCQ9368268.1 preprotein translocase subunit SecE [Brevibacterium sp. 91QC2O2]MCQ9385607.1 preprotein translocase subunit SecE [Brevibacterium sp. 68QC2CO]MCQ9389181.1 preprotein translocase subunit SecE [Brevibacterium sp. 50QC2O2]